MPFQQPLSQGTAAELFGRDGRALLLLRAAWPYAVGPDLARRTEVLALVDRTLRVRVEDARWRRVLHRMQREILNRLWHVAGDLAPKSIGFSEGGEMSIEARPDRRLAPATEAALPPEILEPLSRIEDPELRESFRGTAARYLGRFQTRAR